MIRKGIVVATHPEDHSVDLIMADDFSRLAGVQVMSMSGGIGAGTNDLFAPEEKSGNDKWDISKNKENPIAMVAFTSGGMPVVMGFQYPQIGQMTFKEKNLRVQRHMSDVYSTLNEKGDFEMAWPNGTFFRIGASQDHVDLAGQDVDGKWSISKNTGAALHARFVLGAGLVDLHMDPDGNIELSHQGNLTINTTGNATVNIGGNAEVNVAGTADIDVDGNTSLTTPQLTVDAAESQFTGHVTIQGGLALGGGTGSTAAITGDVNIVGNVTTTGTLQNNSKNVGSTHTHNGVQPGGGNTGQPN